MVFHKACWSAVHSVQSRRTIELICPDTVFYYDPAFYPGAVGAIALTVDDGVCRQSRNAADGLHMVNDVRQVLDEFGAKATFFCCSDFVPGYEHLLEELILDGHELGNHCPADRTYVHESAADFEAALLRAEAVCDNIRCGARELATIAWAIGAFHGPLPPKAPQVKWFRAPQARLSGAMREVLNRHGFTHVLGDCHANDAWITDADFITQTMLSNVTDGSVAVIHFPEKGFREHNLQALRDFLTGVRKQGLHVLNLTGLHRAAGFVDSRSWDPVHPFCPPGEWGDDGDEAGFAEDAPALPVQAINRVVRAGSFTLQLWRELAVKASTSRAGSFVMDPLGVMGGASDQPGSGSNSPSSARLTRRTTTWPLIW